VYTEYFVFLGKADEIFMTEESEALP
jgi:hypothetical protein